MSCKTHTHTYTVHRPPLLARHTHTALTPLTDLSRTFHAGECSTPLLQHRTHTHTHIHAHIQTHTFTHTHTHTHTHSHTFTVVSDNSFHHHRPTSSSSSSSNILHQHQKRARAVVSRSDDEVAIGLGHQLRNKIIILRSFAVPRHG